MSYNVKALDMGPSRRSHQHGPPLLGRVQELPCSPTSALVCSLCYDGQGFWLCTKRLSQGRFTWWPEGADASTRLAARELLILLWNGNPQQAHMAEDWKQLA